MCTCVAHFQGLSQHLGKRTCPHLHGALLGQGRPGGALLRNAEREGILCLTPMAFPKRAQSALQASIHVLST